MKIQATPQINNYNTKYSPTNISFKQNINLENIAKNLSNLRKNDFISDIYENDIFSIEKNKFKKTKINQYFSQKNDNNSDFFDKTPQDAPYKMAALIKKKIYTNESPNIIEKIPELFKGISIKKIFESLDTLSYEIRKNYLKYIKDENSISIENKNINIKYIGKGGNSIVFKLNDGKNDIAMKTYIEPDNVNNFSIWGELALYHDVKNKQINNIPSLYLANPVSEKVEDARLCISNTPIDIDSFKDYDGYKGGWTIVEYINDKSLPRKGGISLQSWLNEKHLYHMDITCDNVKNGFIVDLGGISE